MNERTSQSAPKERGGAAHGDGEGEPVQDTLIDVAPEPDRILDVQGLNCPMPLLRAKLTLSEMSSGQRLLVLATDPYSVMDFDAFCAKTGHPLLAHDEVDGVFRFLLRRK